MTPTRILTVVPDLGRGGTQRAAQNYAVGYARAGRPSAVLAWAGGGAREADLAAADIETFVGADAEERALAWRPTLVHIHRWGDAEPGSASVIERFVRDGHPRPRVIETNVFGRVDRSSARHRIDVHLHLSQWCLWRWSRWAHGLHPSPLGVVVPYAVDPAPFAPLPPGDRAAWRRAHGVPEHAVLFGRIGQPSVGKWHPALLDAFASVAARASDAWLAVVGLPPELRPQLDALPADARARVIEVPFLGDDRALRHAYGSLDVFVHAARMGESFGMVLAEAMLCQTPVVTLSRPARDNSQLEVVGHNVGGLIASTPAGLVSAMHRLHGSPEMRARLGRHARARVLERYALGPVVRRLLAVVEAVETASTPDDLRARLRADSCVMDGVPEATIRGLLASSEDPMPYLDRVAMHAAHRPEVYRLYRALRELRPSPR